MPSIVYYHGFGSSPNSTKVEAIKKRYGAANVSAPVVNPYPEDAYLYLKDFTEFAMKKDPEVILVGTSLGGFWAVLFAKKYGLKAVVMNPVVYPHLTLKNDHAKDRVPGWTDSKADRYEPYFDLYEAYLSQPAMVTVLLEQGDELLDYNIALDKYKNLAYVKVLPGGSHRFTDLETLFSEIDAMDNTEVDFHPV